MSMWSADVIAQLREDAEAMYTEGKITRPELDTRLARIAFMERQA